MIVQGAGVCLCPHGSARSRDGSVSPGSARSWGGSVSSW